MTIDKKNHLDVANREAECALWALQSTEKPN